MEELDYENAESDWKDDVTENCITSFALNLFMNIAGKFPLSTRNWVNSADKKLTNTANSFLKSSLNQSIYLNLIDNIEIN